MTSAEPDATIRPAQPDDTAKIAALIAPFVDAGRLLPRTVEEVRDLVATGFVAVRNEAVVGFAALEIYSKKLAEIRSLAVSEDQQRLGLGRVRQLRYGVYGDLGSAGERLVLHAIQHFCGWHRFRRVGRSGWRRR